MSRTEKNQVKKSKPVRQKPEKPKSAKSVRRANPKSGVMDERMDEIRDRTSMVVSIAAIAGVAAFMLFFFTSDIGERIIQSKSQPVYAAQSLKPSDTNGSGEAGKSGASFHIAVFPGADMSKEKVISYLESLNDEEFDALISTATKNVEPGDLKDDEKSSHLYLSILQGKMSDRAEIMEQLNGMDDAEFNAFIESVVKAVSPDQLENLRASLQTPGDADGGETAADEEERLQQTLEGAYEEAERLYPGRIDGSKRLKLVQDLNATDYLYYVAEQGDTLIKLSEAFGVPLGQLVELNGIRDADKIRAGEILLFPSDTEQPDLQ